MVSLHPIVKWAQDKHNIFVDIELSDCQPEIQLGDTIQFRATQNDQLYEFQLELFDHVSDWTQQQTERHIQLKGRKKTQQWWKQLNKGHKLNYVKTDFGKFQDSDDEESFEKVDQFDPSMLQMVDDD